MKTTYGLGNEKLEVDQGAVKTAKEQLVPYSKATESDKSRMCPKCGMDNVSEWHVMACKSTEAKAEYRKEGDASCQPTKSGAGSNPAPTFDPKGAGAKSEGSVATEASREVQGVWAADKGIIRMAHGDFDTHSKTQAEAICAAHNAALKAEREKHKHIESPDYEELSARLHKKLAAEREKATELSRNIGEMTSQRDEARQQLLAAQAAIAPFAKIGKEVKTNRKLLGILTDDDFECATNVDLSLLAQHDEAVRRPLVDALRSIKQQIILPHWKNTGEVNDHRRWIEGEIDAALAKEGKK
jgi:hypothetical protein